MDLTIQTPAVLFPAISLLLIAYTNKFLAIANLIRNLSSDYYKRSEEERPLLLRQIASLRRRVMLIRWMQAAGVASILCCVLTMFALYAQWQTCAKVIFALALLLMIASLILSLIEIFLSAGALRMVLLDLQEKEQGQI